MTTLGRSASAYRRESVLTDSPVRLVVRLFDAALTALARAAEHREKGHAAQATRHLGQAHAIVGELFAALDMERGGEIAARLQSLYDFLLTRLLVPPADRDRIAHAVRILTSLREGFDAAARSAS